jgi:hypothetical protein
LQLFSSKVIFEDTVPGDSSAHVARNITITATTQRITTSHNRDHRPTAPQWSSMELWKRGLVAPQAAATELPVAGLAQWVCCLWGMVGNDEFEYLIMSYVKYQNGFRKISFY